MTSKKQILLAFFIPLFLAIGLLLFYYSFLQPECSYTFIDNGKVICGYENYDVPIASEECALLILGLFLLSLVLPSFVMMQTYQGRRNQLESPSIIE